MDGNTKPTFGVGTSTTPDAVDTVRQQRPEIGAIWERKSMKTGSTYLNIRLKLPKKKLEELLASAKDDEPTNVNFVAFTNKNKEENPKRPSFRVYEEIPRPTED